MVEKEALIAAVFKRRPIWDPRHNKYRNRSVLQTMWNQIERELGEDREILTSKWRTLRTHFGRELRKLNSFKGDTESAQSTWPYFQQMSFLREIWKNDENDPNIETPKTTETINDKYPKHVSFEDCNENVAVLKLEMQIPKVSDDDSDEDYDDENNDDKVTDINQSANKDEKQENFDNRKIDKDLLNNETLDTQKIFEELTIGVRSPQNIIVTTGDRKRNITDTAQENVPSKKMKENLDICVASTSTSSPLAPSPMTPHADCDKDLFFFKSILPDLKTLPRVRKMYLKLKVQEMLYEEILPKDAEDDEMCIPCDCVDNN